MYPVKMPGIGPVEVIRSEIRTTTKPRIHTGASLVVIQFEIPVVGVHGWDQGTAGMDDQRNSRGQKPALIYPEPASDQLGQYTMYYRGIHPTFFKNIPIGNHTGLPAPLRPRASSCP